MILKLKQTVIAMLFIFGFVVGVQASGVPIIHADSIFGGAKQQVCEGTDLSGSGDCEKAQANRVENLIARIINILSLIIGVVAVIMIIINGLRFITSGGDSNAVSSAKKGILYAIVGLVIVALAQFIVRFVLNIAEPPSS